MNFSPDGHTLASVSTSPDYMLTIWEWADEKMGLHAKAFGQDVYNVNFSLDDPGRMTTSGVGHIRFWKMASTFTGLKLQGSIGKFGKIDLSDIDTFVELPDGKVVSGTETGSLLVWEGHFIKCRLTRSGGQSCHAGMVSFLALDRVEKKIISAGHDGYIRWWDFSQIDTAEVDSDHSMDFDLEPLAELYLGENIGVKTMLDSGSQGRQRLLVILDTTGRLMSLTFAVHEKAMDCERLPLADTISCIRSLNRAKLSDPRVDEDFIVDEEEKFFIDKRVFENFHSAAISGMDTCPVDHLVATCSSDGTVRCMDYVRRKTIAFRSFPCGATCLKWLPRQLDPTGKMIAVGFADGCVRILALGEPESVADSDQLPAQRNTGDQMLSFLRKMVFKPHNAPVLDLAFSPDSSVIATSGADGIIFYLQCAPMADEESVRKPVWSPVRFVTVAPNANAAVGAAAVSAKQMSWSPDGFSMLATCTDGVLREIGLKPLRALIADAGAAAEEIVSFEGDFPKRDVVVRVPIVTAVAASSSSSAMAKSSSSSSIAAGGGGAKTGAESEASSPVKTASASVAAISDTNSENNNNNNTRPSTADSTATAGAGGGSAAAGPATTVTASQVPAKISAAIFSIKRPVMGILTGASLNQKNYVFENDRSEELPFKELISGLYAADGKDRMKTPVNNFFRYSRSKKFLISGTSDGMVVLRPSDYLEVFVRAPGHAGGAGAGGGALFGATSFDDSFLLSSGSDGTLSVRRVRLDLIRSRAGSLYRDIDAGVYVGTPIKPIPASGPAPEPNYMNYVSTLVESNEKALFSIPEGSDNNIEELPQTSVLEEVAIEADESDLAPGTYSIQDNRLKLEEDAKKVAADQLKSRVKASILALRKDYENILRENEAIPEVARLSAEELMVDKEYMGILHRENEAMIEEVHKECEYEAEKAAALLKKLNARMRNGLIMEEISLSAFNPPTGGRSVRSVVKSFRAQALEESVSNILVDVHKMVRATELKEAQDRTNENAQRKADEAMGQLMNRLRSREAGDSGGGGPVDEAAAAVAQLDLKDGYPGAGGNNNKSGEGHGAHDLATESSVGARRIKRIERKEALRKHQAAKPNEDEDDIRDVNSIRLAEKTIGDYKLKSGEDYEVPEEQRSNALKKVRQMAMLEESMLSMRLQFNERFLALRNLKRQMIYAIRRDNKRIREIDAELEQPHKSQALWEPTFDPEEFPDDADEVTEKELQQFEADRQSAPWEKVKPPKQVVVTGTKTVIKRNPKNDSFEATLCPRKTESRLENILSSTELVEYTPPRTEQAKFYEVNPSVLKNFVKDRRSPAAQRLYELEQTVPSLRRIQTALHRRMHLQDKSAVQQKEVAAARHKLEFERTMVLKKMNENIAAFSEAVDDLRTDRHSITADLQLTQLKMLVLYQEYQLLQTFEGRDAALQQKQIRCKGEESEIKALASENKSKLEGKEDEIQHWTDKLAQIQVEFKAMLPDSHPYCETLTKIFRKKIKRNKGREDGDDEDDYDDDDVRIYTYI
jgi:WD40 repeat protein